MTPEVKTMEEVKGKNDFIIWLNTNEGQDCVQPQDFTKPGSIRFLENRLWYAFTAGQGLQLKIASAELQAERQRSRELLEVLIIVNHGWEIPIVQQAISSYNKTEKS